MQTEKTAFRRRMYSSAYCELGDGKGNNSYFHECGSKRLGCEEVQEYWARGLSLDLNLVRRQINTANQPAVNLF